MRETGIKLEEGKTYRTRDGTHCVTIEFTKNFWGYPEFYGKATVGKGTGQYSSWFENGLWTPGGETHNDLVAVVDSNLG